MPSGNILPLLRDVATSDPDLSDRIAAVRAFVEDFGSQKDAADAIGISQPNLSKALNPEKSTAGRLDTVEGLIARWQLGQSRDTPRIVLGTGGPIHEGPITVPDRPPPDTRSPPARGRIEESAADYDRASTDGDVVIFRVSDGSGRAILELRARTVQVGDPVEVNVQTGLSPTAP